MHGLPTHKCLEKGLKKGNISLVLYSEDLDNVLFIQYSRNKRKQALKVWPRDTMLDSIATMKYRKWNFRCQWRIQIPS